METGAGRWASKFRFDLFSLLPPEGGLAFAGEPAADVPERILVGAREEAGDLRLDLELLMLEVRLAFLSACIVIFGLFGDGPLESPACMLGVREAGDLRLDFLDKSIEFELPVRLVARLAAVGVRPSFTFRKCLTRSTPATSEAAGISSESNNKNLLTKVEFLILATFLWPSLLFMICNSPSSL